MLSNYQGVNGKLRRNEHLGNNHESHNKIRNLFIRRSTIKTGAYRALKESFNFIELFGKLMGWQMNYEWKEGPRHWITIGYLMFTWCQVFYTQYLYLANGEPMKTFKVFATYGVGLSVIILKIQ